MLNKCFMENKIPTLWTIQNYRHTEAWEGLCESQELQTNIPLVSCIQTPRKNDTEQNRTGMVNLNKEPAKGYDSPWLIWRCLNRLHTGYTCSKEQRKNGATLIETQHVHADWMRKIQRMCFDVLSSHIPAHWNQ